MQPPRRPKPADEHRVLRDEPFATPGEAFAIEHFLPHGHIEAILEATLRLGLGMAARLLNDSTLTGELSFDAVDEDALYEAMYWLGERQRRIECRLTKRHLTENRRSCRRCPTSVAWRRSPPTPTPAST